MWPCFGTQNTILFARNVSHSMHCIGIRSCCCCCSFFFRCEILSIKKKILASIFQAVLFPLSLAFIHHIVSRILIPRLKFSQMKFDSCSVEFIFEKINGIIKIGIIYQMKCMHTFRNSWHFKIMISKSMPNTLATHCIRDLSALFLVADFHFTGKWSHLPTLHYAREWVCAFYVKFSI